MPPSPEKLKAWKIDQLTKSHYFHAKLYEWGLLDVQDDIEAVKGDELPWNGDILTNNDKREEFLGLLGI